MNKEALRIHNKLIKDLPFFCRKAPLVIKTKDSKLVPFKLNKAQRYIHEKLERQKKATGKVRAWILKGRQQGVSTYIAARFYHQTTRNKGISTFILSHESSTTDKLFKLVKRYHASIAKPLKPSTANSNRKELVFDRLDSDYFVGTAGNENVGRGGTPQLFHGSEVAFWPNPDEIKKGVIQSVPDMAGTEIIHESTANGMDQMFYKGIKEAIAGKSDYQVIFVPWFWQEEYSRECPHNHSFSEAELEYATLHGLNDDQLYWRQLKVAELGGDNHFRQEYPATINEAFETSGGGLIKSEWVIKARRNKVDSRQSPVVLGVDPARDGDRTVIAVRQGRRFANIFKYDNMNQMLLAGKIANFLEEYEVKKCFIDVAHGHGCIDRLDELGFGHIVQGVHFGEQAIESDIYLNKRVEIAFALKEWIEREGVDIPDDEEIHADLTAIPDYLITSSGKKKLPAKDEIKKNLGFSPDIFDAMALTFSYPINEIQRNVRITNISKPLGNRRR